MHPKIKELQLRATPINYADVLETRAAEVDDNRRIKGYLAVWNTRDDRGTAFVKGCFSKSLQERGVDSTGKYKIKFLWQHNQSDPLSNFEVLREDETGLYFEAVPDEVPSGDRAVMQVRSGTLNQFSVGFNYVWDKIEWDDSTDTLMLKEVELYEGSIVTIPSNKDTFAVRSAEQFETEFDMLNETTEGFIRSIPRDKQLELRSLLTRHISLAKVEPLELRQQALKQTKPTEAIDYQYLLNNFNLQK